VAFGRSLLLCAALLLCLPLAACGPSQCDEASSIVQAAYDRLNEGDVDGYLGYFSDDAVVMSEGQVLDREAVVEYYTGEVVEQETRFEPRDLTCDGNVVTYALEILFRETSLAKYDDAVDVVVDGQIIFDGFKSELLAECDRDPSQAFCP